MQILQAEPLQPYNTLALQANARALVRIGSDAELTVACRWAREQALPVIPLGQGSNIVLAGDIEALLVRLDTRGMEILLQDAGQVRLRVAAGENWHQLVSWSLQQGYYGLENLALIPGTVGAAPVQNIGAYGVELCSFIEAVHILQPATGEVQSLQPGDCAFGYRDSVFKQELRDQVVITAVDLRLATEPRVQASYPALAGYLDQQGIAKPSPRQIFEAVVAIRQSKLPDPSREPNAGSFFKNPVLDRAQSEALLAEFPGLPSYPQPDSSVKIPAAWLIDYCGWKGFRRDGVGVHPEHALVLVNYGSDSGAALLALAGEIAATVADTFGIELVIEPRIYG